MYRRFGSGLNCSIASIQTVGRVEIQLASPVRSPGSRGSRPQPSAALGQARGYQALRQAINCASECMRRSLLPGHLYLPVLVEPDRIDAPFRAPPA